MAPSAPLFAAPSRTGPSDLQADESGAITVLGMVFSMLLIALLFYALGIGRTILAQEGMQDAADAAGFASAVIHARGMNLIVYINWVMAALLAILIALRLLQSLFMIGTIIFYGLAGPTFGATLPIAGFCQGMERSFASAYNAAKPPIDALLRISHLAEKGVSVVVPAIATLGALGEAAESHPPANGAFALPASVSLPVESDKFSVACERGGELVGDLVLAPLGPEMAGQFGDAIGDLVKSMTAYFCGDGKGEPPTYPRTVERVAPEFHGKDCKTPEECAEADRRNQEERPNLALGDPCPPYSACEFRAARARAHCRPLSGSTPSSYQYLQEEVEVVYRFEQNKVIEDSRKIKSSQLINSETIPCADKPVDRFRSWSDWDLELRPNQEKFPRPLCKGVAVTVTRRPGNGQSASGRSPPIPETHIAHILSCTFQEKIEEPLTEKGETAGGDESKSPMKVEKDLALGGEAFQVRTVAWGDGVGPGYFKDGVKLAFTKQEPEGAEETPSVSQSIEGFSAEAMTFLGKVSIAQSEYYFADIDASAQESDWMWRPAWTARLRRFRLPSNEEKQAEQDRVQARSSIDDAAREKFGGMQASSDPESSCQASMGECAGLTDALPSLDALVIH